MWKIELKAEPIGGPLPARHAQIIVSDFTRSGDSMPELSPDLMTMSELEHYLTKLRKQLDQIEQEGREYFSAPLFR